MEYIKFPKPGNRPRRDVHHGGKLLIQTRRTLFCFCSRLDKELSPLVDTKHDRVYNVDLVDELYPVQVTNLRCRALIGLVETTSEAILSAMKVSN